MTGEAVDDDETVMRRPPAETPVTQPRLLCSVGRFGINWGDDVVLVRALLAAAVPGTPAAASGRRCDEALVAAIVAYQSEVLGLSPASGRIDPTGTTSVALGAG